MRFRPFLKIAFEKIPEIQACIAAQAADAEMNVSAKMNSRSELGVLKKPLIADAQRPKIVEDVRARLIC